MSVTRVESPGYLRLRNEANVAVEGVTTSPACSRPHLSTLVNLAATIWRSRPLLPIDMNACGSTSSGGMKHEEGLQHLAPERGFIASEPLQDAIVEICKPLEAMG